MCHYFNRKFTSCLSTFSNKLYFITWLFTFLPSRSFFSNKKKLFFSIYFFKGKIWFQRSKSIKYNRTYKANVLHLRFHLISFDFWNKICLYTFDYGLICSRLKMKQRCLKKGNTKKNIWVLIFFSFSFSFFGFLFVWKEWPSILALFNLSSHIFTKKKSKKNCSGHT